MEGRQFEIGDRIKFIDEDLSGVVSKIENEQIFIKTDDGFEYPCLANEIIKAKSFEAQLSSTEEVEFLNQNEENLKNWTRKSVKTNKTQPVMEVDLHIHQLVENTRGLSNYDMLEIQLNTVKRKMEFAKSKRIQRIVFIHGVGEGVLKYELVRILKDYPVQISEANYLKYGQGATEVFLRLN